MSVAQEGVRHSRTAVDLAGPKITQENGILTRERDGGATDAVVGDPEHPPSRDARFDNHWSSSTNGPGGNADAKIYKTSMNKNSRSSSVGRYGSTNSISNATSEYRESDDAPSEMRAQPDRVARPVRAVNAVTESTTKPPPVVETTIVSTNEAIDARAQVTTPVSPPPSPPTGHAAPSSLKPVSTARSSSSNHTTPKLSSKTTVVDSSDDVPTPSATARGGAPLASLLLSDHRDATEPVQPVVEERKDGLTHVTTPPSPESLAQMGHSRTVSKTDSAFTSIERSSTSKDSRDEEGMDVDPPSSAVSRTADRVRSPSGAPTADAPPLSAVSPRPAPGFPTVTSNVPHHGVLQSSLSPATPITGPTHDGYRSHHHRRHSLTQSQGSQIRSRGGEDAHQSKSIPSRYPQPLSPRSQLTSFHTDPAQERESRMAQGSNERAEMLDMIEQQRTVVSDLRAQLDHQARMMERRDDHYRHAERERMEWIGRVTDWLRAGQQLLSEASQTGSTAAYQTSMRPSNSPGVLGRNGTVASLSSAVASSRAATQRELAREIERDRTLILASPATPYTLSNHSRPPLSHHDSRGALRPTTSPRLEHPPRNSSQNDTSYRPPHLGHAHSYSHESSGHSSLRRSRRPSSDDLASAAGNKRIKTTDNGNYIRVSGDNGVTDRGPYTRDGYDTRPSLSSNSHRSYGGYPNADMAEHDAQGYAPKSATSTRMASAEHTRASPLDRRLGGGRIEEEEEFPSPLRSYASPAGTPTVTENGNGIPKIKPSPLREQYKSGPPSASIPGPDEEHANSLEAHKALMELGDDEDSMAHSQRSSLRRTGSHAATQDVDEMLAEVTGDGSEERGEDPSRLSSKARYRASTSTVTPNPGGTISSFALPAGQRTDSFSRSPEASGHRASNSGSFSTSSLVSPSGNGLVHMQFLPPHSGPPMPKKIYHTKNTGQVIGSQNLATTMSSGTLDPSYVAPKQGAQATSYTIDGLPKRTCKQCGQPGRYRDNKCVEKWGPGPQGPGTVCDRCRKKMKRVEKRATQDSNAMAAAALQHQYPIAPAPNPSGSFSQHSQASQRLEESQDYGYSQANDGHSQPSLSRSGSHSHGSRQSSAQLVRRDSTLPYPPPASEETRGAMPPPAAPWTGARTSPQESSIRSSDRDHRSHPPPRPTTGNSSSEKGNRSGTGSRDGDVDADGDAEMDELDDDNSAVADGAAASRSGHNNNDRPKQEAP